MSKNFIIIESDPIVCMDLEGMLISRYADSHIASGASLQDIGAAIYNCGPDTTLFVRAGLLKESSDLTRVIQMAATRGSHIVIMGQCVDLPFPATCVDLPFTTDMVISVIDSRHTCTDNEGCTSS